MRRHVFAALAALSLLACAWGVVLWQRSYHPLATPNPSTARIQTQLTRLLPALQFDFVGLFDVIDFLRDVSGADIQLNSYALKAARVGPNTPITESIRNIPFGEALAKILADTGGNVHFATDGSQIVISTREDLSRPNDTERLPAVPGNVDHAMRRGLGPLEFQEVPLAVVLQFIGARTGVSIVVDWKTLESAGARPSTVITLKANGGPMPVGPIARRYRPGRPASPTSQGGISGATALSRLLRICGATQPLQFQVRQSEVFVSTAATFDATSARTHRIVWLEWAGGSIALLAIIAAMVWRRGRLRRKTGGPVRWRWASLATAAVCAAMVAAITWVHGIPSWEKVFHGRRYTLTAHQGTLRFWSTPADPAEPYQSPVKRAGRANAPDQDIVLERLGVSLRRGGYPFDAWVCRVPAWEWVSLTAILPLLWLVLTIRRRPYGPGQCQRCGYDLRASTERCPECGAPIIASDSKATASL